MNTIKGSNRVKRQYRLWGRVERLSNGKSRAIAAASPIEPGGGPLGEDVRAHMFPVSESRIGLAALMYGLDAAILARGDVVASFDLPR